MTRNSILIAATMLGAGLGFPAGAADGHHHHATSERKPAVSASTQWAAGEVRGIDKAAGKLTIKHGPMPKFDMPPMTMAYRVKDRTLLDRVKPGDKIRFDVDGAGGEFTVSQIEKVK